MKVILFGATGMVGQGALLACLESPEVTHILAVGRAPTGVRHDKLKSLIHKDFLDFSKAEDQFKGYGACFWCLGISSVGLSEPDYTRVTLDFTLAAARSLVKVNPAITFVFVSATGADSSERGSSMWARIKGKAENGLFKLPFKSIYVLRPGFIQPLDGIKSRTKLYNFFYVAFAPVFPLLRAAMPRYIITTRTIGQTMIHLAKLGASKPILHNSDMKELVEA